MKIYEVDIFWISKICVKWSASYLASYFVSMIIINGKNFKIFCIMAHAKKCTYRQNKTKPTKSRRRTPMAIFDAWLRFPKNPGIWPHWVAYSVLTGQIAPTLKRHLAPNKGVDKNHEIFGLYTYIIIFKIMVKKTK